MELVYFYPKRDDAPSRVGKSILRQLVCNRARLPFDDIKVFIAGTNVNYDECLTQIDTVTLSDLMRNMEKYLVHIPISPSIIPNKKFLLNLLCIIKKKPLIIHYHGDARKHVVTKFKYEKELDVLSIPSALFMPYLLKTATKVVTHSYLLNNTIRSQYGVKSSIVIPNGLDDYWFIPLKKDQYENIIDKDNFNIFYHGRLSPEKGVDILIKAIGKYSRINPKARLYVAGDGSQRKYLQKLCLRLKLNEKVIFLGNIDREEIKFFLKSVNAAIYPSRFDNFPLAIIEALACADCPVYFSENTGICDFVKRDGLNLKIFKPTVENIYKIMCSSMEKKIVKSQKKFARKYRWNKIINLYIDLYNDVCNSVI